MHDVYQYGMEQKWKVLKSFQCFTQDTKKKELVKESEFGKDEIMTHIHFLKEMDFYMDENNRYHPDEFQQMLNHYHIIQRQRLCWWLWWN